jgi:hypothetical protein
MGFGSPHASNVAAIWLCRSMRSVMTSRFGLVSRSDTTPRWNFSFSAANTMVRLLPLPCVCQTSPAWCWCSTTRCTILFTARSCW